MKKYIHPAVRIIVAIIVLAGAAGGWIYIITGNAAYATPGGKQVADVMMATGYTYHLLKSVELAAGMLLLFNFWRPLALVMLAPVTASVLVLHLTDSKGLPMALLLAAGMIYLFAYDWRRITSILNEPNPENN